MESTEEEKIVAAAKEKTKELHNLLSAKNLDHDKFFELIVKHSKNFDRQIMVDEYQEQFSENLFDVLNKKFSGELKEIVTFLFYNPYELDARIINNSLRGKKRDEKAVIEIICSRPYWYLQTVDQEYFRLYNIHLKDELNKEKSAEFKSFLICILTTPRAVGQSFKNEKQVSEVVNTINKHTLKKYGKEVELFKDVFVRRSREDLTLIAREFRNADSKKRNLYDVVDSTCPDKTKEILKAIIYSVIMPSHYFAHLLKKAIIGAGTDNKVLNRVLVTRAEVDMENIRNYYKLETKNELVKDIEGDTSGNYRKITKMLGNL